MHMFNDQCLERQTLKMDYSKMVYDDNRCATRQMQWHKYKANTNVHHISHTDFHNKAFRKIIITLYRNDIAQNQNYSTHLFKASSYNKYPLINIHNYSSYTS